MQTIAQSWLVLKLTNSGTQLGLVSAAQFLPVLVFGPLGGVVVDRFNKRRLIFITQTAFTVIALAFGILLTVNAIKLWMIYFLASAFGLITAIDTPARQAFTYEMAGPEHIQNAVSLNSTLFNASRIFGPALAGALIASVGLSACYYFNAASFLAVLIALALINTGSLHAGETIKKAGGQFFAGLKYVSSQRILKDILILMALVGTFLYEFQVTIPLLAKNTFSGGAGVYAALTSSMGLGAVLGGLYSATRKDLDFKHVKNAVWFLGTITVLASLSPNIYVAALALAILGFFSTVFASTGNATLQLNSTPEMRGRVLALWNTCNVGSTPIGGPIIGYIGQTFSPRWALATGGGAALIAAIYDKFSAQKNQNQA